MIVELRLTISGANIDNKGENEVVYTWFLDHDTCHELGTPEKLKENLFSGLRGMSELLRKKGFLRID